MIDPETLSARLSEFIVHLFPYEHGHRQKAITAFVAALIVQQTCCQAGLARAFDNFEAAAKRISRLIHNERLKDRRAADAILQQALLQLPTRGLVRLAIDWTIEADQHLLVVSLIIGRRAIPIYWRAYEASVLKGRRTRYERAVIKRVLTRLLKHIQPGRLIVSADRGFADVDLCDLLDSFKITYVLRVKCSTKVYWAQTWCSLSQIGFVGNSRHRELGRILYCASSPHRLWLTLSRQRDKLGEWEVWYLLSNRKRSAAQMADEYAHRMGCDESFRDAKWWLGFAKAHISDIRAWSRMFVVVATTMLAIAALSVKVLLSDKPQASRLLRRVTSRRRGRCELGWFSAMLLLLVHNLNLLDGLSPYLRLDLNARLPNVS
jgi:Transposase DDE domain